MSSIDSFSHLFPYFNNKFRKCEQILSFIGLYFVCKFTLNIAHKVLRFSYVHIWSQIRGNHLNVSNGWAVITFVSNEIGVSFANLLAEKGFNLILIDEKEDVLEVISNQLVTEFKVEVKKMTINVSTGLEAYDSIREELKDKDITLLLNNVFTDNEFTDNYSDFKPKQLFKILYKEMASVLIMTSMVLPKMEQKKHGYIINVSSILAAAPIPYLSVHSAAKAFVDRFSTSLSYECKPKGIIVQSLMPSLCSHHSITGLIAPTYQSYTKLALNTIGRSNRTTGYLWHEFQYWLLERAPQHFSSYFLNSFKSDFCSHKK